MTVCFLEYLDARRVVRDVLTHLVCRLLLEKKNERSRQCERNGMQAATLQPERRSREQKRCEVNQVALVRVRSERRRDVGRLHRCVKTEPDDRSQQQTAKRAQLTRRPLSGRAPQSSKPRDDGKHTKPDRQGACRVEPEVDHPVFVEARRYVPLEGAVSEESADDQARADQEDGESDPI